MVEFKNSQFLFSFLFLLTANNIEITQTLIKKAEFSQSHVIDVVYHTGRVMNKPTYPIYIFVKLKWFTYN